MKHWLLAGAIALLAGACSPSTGPDAGPPATTLAEFGSQLDRLRAQLAIPGMAAIVMAHDTVVWEGSLGVADIPSQRPVTPTTHLLEVQLRSRAVGAFESTRAVERGVMRTPRIR